MSRLVSMTEMLQKKAKKANTLLVNSTSTT